MTEYLSLKCVCVCVFFVYSKHFGMNTPQKTKVWAFQHSINRIHVIYLSFSATEILIVKKIFFSRSLSKWIKE